MIDYMAMLLEFHTKYKHRVSNYPVGFMDYATYDLRKKLMEEELKELIFAMYAGDVNQIADGLADLLYVVFGTALAYGIPIDKIFAEVHRSNMTKSTDKNSYGKTIKGDNFVPPRIAEILGGELE